MLELGLKFTLSYGLGAVMGGLVVGYFSGGVDIRNSGSGNLGGTNALRTRGMWFALWVMLIDVGKGIVAVTVVPPLQIPGIGLDPELDRALLTYAVAFGAILGHVFPIWSDFRGGKGGATAAGLLCYFSASVAVPVLGAWLLIVFFSGYVGIATVAATLGAAVYVGVTGLPEERGLFLFACAVGALTTYAHRSNLRRMLEGTESRFGRYFGWKR